MDISFVKKVCLKFNLLIGWEIMNKEEMNKIEWIDINERKPEEDEKIIYLTKISNSVYCNIHGMINEIWVDIITHWYPFNLPFKKRWKPKDGEMYYTLFNLSFHEYYNITHEYEREYFGVYKTEEEAQKMRDKIRKFITEEIGEV